MNDKTRKVGIAVAIGTAGVVAGGVLAGTLSASAQSSGQIGIASSSPGYAAPVNPANPANPDGDPSKPLRSDEKLLTGTTEQKVTAAVEKKYPDATIQRVETDSDGVYEAHIVDGGTPITVQVGKDFTITGTQTGGPGGPGGPHGDADGDGDGEGPGAPTQG